MADRLQFVRSLLAAYPFETKVEVLVALLANQNVRQTLSLLRATPQQRAALQKMPASFTLDPELRAAIATWLSELVPGEVERRIAAWATADIRPAPPSPPTSGVTGPVIRVDFSAADEHISAAGLAEFLDLFSKVYAVAARRAPSPSAEATTVGESEAALRLEARATSRALAADRGDFKRATVDVPAVVAIHKASPLTIWFAGLSSALVVAVIVAGGEIDLLKLRFKVAALGDGIAKLRKALARKKRPRSAVRKKARR